MSDEPLIPKHGGYRKLKSFQVAQLCYDVTVRFATATLRSAAAPTTKWSRPRAAACRTIAEGSKERHIKKMELKLTNVVRASLEELRLDCEDFPRHRRLPLWENTDPRRAALIARRCATSDAVAAWIGESMDKNGQHGRSDSAPSSIQSTPSIKSIGSTYPELAANAALVLIGVACALLDRQIEAQAAAFTEEGGFTERLHRIRTTQRRNPPKP